MRISQLDLLSSFDRINLSKHYLDNALRLMGKENLKNKRMRDLWTPDYPSTCYCYNVSEFAYWYCIGPHKCSPMVVYVPSLDMNHWFLDMGGVRIDLTADQFANYSDVDYTKARGKGFLPIKGGGPSRRTRLLARYMLYDEDDWQS